MVQDTFPSIDSSRRQHSKLGVGTILAALLLAGSLNISSSTVAQADEACVAACKAEAKKCPEKMYTSEMCAEDLKDCTTACEKK